MMDRIGALGVILMVLVGYAAPWTAAADDPQGDCAPLLAKYCNSCHGGDKPKAGLDLMRLSQSGVNDRGHEV
jgi:hypothetical protein